MKRIVASVVVACVMMGCAGKGGEGAKASGADREFDAVKEPPVTADTYYAAGLFAEGQANPGKAVEQYRAAVKVKADHQPSLYRLGVVCTQLKLYPEAVAAWKGYIKATGDAAGGYSNLGFTYQLSGDDGAAEVAYKAGITRDPRNRPCRVNYGLMLARQGKLDSAISQWQAVLTPAEVHYNLASVHEQRGEKAQARVEYRKALELDPAFSDAKAKLAQLDKD